MVAPVEDMGVVEYQTVTSGDVGRIVHPEVRLAQPVKFFFYSPQQKVTEDEIPSSKETVILGVKACDLQALAALDKIFLGEEFVDPFYEAKRNKTILISSDCTDALDVCFCNLLGNTPFPEDGFDLNVSFIDGGVLIEVGSDRGKSLLEKCKVPYKTAGESQLKLRRKNREKVSKKLAQINKDFIVGENILELLKEGYDSPVWQEFCETCVGCGACTNICPACHCFLLSEEALEKIRLWDSCQYTGFARVAGGANPRKKLADRFKNRFYCKFQYKPENFDLRGCTGCGRCIEACQGKIDIREPLTKLTKGS